MNAVEASLKRLGTEYIDLLQIHRYDPTVPVEETMQALHDLVRWNKVRYIGTLGRLPCGAINSPRCKSVPQPMAGPSSFPFKGTIVSVIARKKEK